MAMRAIEDRNTPPQDPKAAALWHQQRGIRARLDAAIQVVLNPHPDVGIEIPALPPHVRAAAESELAKLEVALKPIGDATGDDAQAAVDAVKALLTAVNALCRNPQPPEQLAATARAMAAALSDLPLGAFNPRTTKAAVNALDYLPTPKELRALLTPRVAPYIARRNALVTLLQAKPPERREPTPEERAAVSAKAAEFAAEMRAMAQRPASRSPVLQRPTSPQDLLAMWEAEAAKGTPGAAMRAAALRRQLGLEIECGAPA